MESIKRLPKNDHSIVRSSIILFDLPRVVEELIYNSIDAGSSKVFLSLSHTHTHTRSFSLSLYLQFYSL
jgi:DNA mismatch repair protein MLH3